MVSSRDNSADALQNALKVRANGADANVLRALAAQSDGSSGIEQLAREVASKADERAQGLRDEAKKAEREQWEHIHVIKFNYLQKMKQQGQQELDLWYEQSVYAHLNTKQRRGFDYLSANPDAILIALRIDDQGNLEKGASDEISNSRLRQTIVRLSALSNLDEADESSLCKAYGGTTALRTKEQALDLVSAAKDDLRTLNEVLSTLSPASGLGKLLGELKNGLHTLDAQQAVIQEHFNQLPRAALSLKEIFVDGLRDQVSHSLSAVLDKGRELRKMQGVAPEKEVENPLKDSDIVALGELPNQQARAGKGAQIASMLTSLTRLS